MDKHKELNRVDITPARIREVIRRPSNFAYFGEDRDVMFKTWAMGPTLRHRDCTILDQSNAAALEKHLEKDWPELADDWRIERASHWAVGWVEHLVFRALEENGEPTTIFKVLELWFNSLQDYPVADESDYSEREYEAAIENIRTVLHEIDPDLDDAYPGDIFGWLWDNDQGELDNQDGHGACPSEESVRNAVIALGFVSKIGYNAETE